MAEYIEREAFLDDIQARYCADCDNHNGVMCKACWVDDMYGEIMDAPAADVQEVERGEWDLFFGGKELQCSVCKATFWDEEQNGGTNYCPNCGAKMGKDDAG